VLIYFTERLNSQDICDPVCFITNGRVKLQTQMRQQRCVSTSTITHFHEETDVSKRVSFNNNLCFPNKQMSSNAFNELL